MLQIECHVRVTLHTKKHRIVLRQLVIVTRAFAIPYIPYCARSSTNVNREIIPALCGSMSERGRAAKIFKLRFRASRSFASLWRLRLVSRELQIFQLHFRYRDEQRHPAFKSGVFFPRSLILT